MRSFYCFPKRLQTKTVLYLVVMNQRWLNILWVLFLLFVCVHGEDQKCDGEKNAKRNGQYVPCERNIKSTMIKMKWVTSSSEMNCLQVTCSPIYITINGRFLHSAPLVCTTLLSCVTGRGDSLGSVKKKKKINVHWYMWITHHVLLHLSAKSSTMHVDTNRIIKPTGLVTFIF